VCVLAEQTTHVDDQAYTVRVVETGHHIIALVLNGSAPLLELRLSGRACQEGLLQGKLKGDSAAVGQEISRTMQTLLVQGLTASNVASQP
jgi:hypothetical protein